MQIRMIHRLPSLLSVCAIVATILFSTGTVQSTQAQVPGTDPNFNTDLITTYTVNEGGRTRVEHALTITNLKPLFTVSQYALQVNSPNITDVVVTGPNNKEIPFQAITTDTVSSIAIEFTDQVVGQGKQRTFTISYTDPDAAIISGQVLEVAVPRIQEPGTYNSYTVQLITPIKYGSPNKTNPENHTVEISESGLKTTFTQDHFNGVNAIYGTEQIFDITLRYHLENPHSSVRLAQIALPPDTQFQRVVYNTLTPQPDNMERDIDGNWIATYRIPATTTIDVTAQLQAQITLEQNQEVVIDPPTSVHTKAAEYWPINSSIVKDTALLYRTPREIYNFTTETLSYDYDLINNGNVRLGADTVLHNPLQALCQEFTDVFIALSRANNIPARRLTGYAHTENSVLRPLSLVEDVLHAWPEYYDSQQQRWIPVDPTWGNTSGGINYFDQLDLNHIVFAINGESSQRPYPAGSYKATAVESKDVEVTFGSFFRLPESSLTFSTETPPFSWLPFWKTPQLIVQNTGTAAVYSQTLSLQPLTESATLWPANQIEITTLLPFETYRTPLVILDSERILPRPSTIGITYGDSYQEITILSYPEYWQWFFSPFVVLGVVGSGISLALVAGSILVLKRRR